MPALKRKKDVVAVVINWLPVLVCMGIIFRASSIPGSNIPSLFPFQDIAFHAFIYALLAFFFRRALKNTFLTLTFAKIIAFTVLFGLIYGVSDEFHQLFVPNRSADFFDILIDTVGSLTGSLAFRWRR